jgi:hypothetical protein
LLDWASHPAPRRTGYTPRMSQLIRVYLSGSRLPDVALWQAALTAHGFAFVLDPSVSLPTHGGYLPVTCDGIETGFEFGVDPVSAAEIAAFGGRDQRATFRWGSDLHELVAASACAAVFAALTGGVYLDAESGDVVPAETALADARASRDEFLCPTDEPPPQKPWWKFW